MKRWLAVLLVLLGGCSSHTLLAPEDRATLEETLTRPEPQRYLRLSMHVTPFFGDASKRLLTPYPPEEVLVLNDLRGRTVSPGPIQATLPAGARARILKVEFPTSWVVAERVLYTPRTWPWAYVEVEGTPAGPPLVLLLPPHHKTREDFLAEVDRFLSLQPLQPRLSEFSAEIREAIGQKKAVTGMPAEALEMSWGYPEKILRSLEGTSRLETWTYPGGRRRAYLTDGRLTRVEETPAPAPARP
ncbi:hypothetical protein POL68_00165 [Stigmatella sp. ncwal1]|uniref:Lipoprotein n=1 Tax=Stigmatella ashevillensis TaxID=2995309 RepID=A0ABT5D1Y1_9BACT|nr:hypothetical protein [Stigmatella ashevillena]MDC0706878.1 hypothetical protein [Stigmatella ashevillena]